MEKLVVTIYSRNSDGKQGKIVEPFNDLTSVVRFMLTYKPKRGYIVDRYTVDTEWWLV